jgi:hypothetical protein
MHKERKRNRLAGYDYSLDNLKWNEGLNTEIQRSRSFAEFVL